MSFILSMSKFKSSIYSSNHLIDNEISSIPMSIESNMGIFSCFNIISINLHISYFKDFNSTFFMLSSLIHYYYTISVLKLMLQHLILILIPIIIILKCITLQFIINTIYWFNFDSSYIISSLHHLNDYQTLLPNYIDSISTKNNYIQYDFTFHLKYNIHIILIDF